MAGTSTPYQGGLRQRREPIVFTKPSTRQVTIMVVAVCVAVIGAPVAARAASAVFTSNSASTPAVSAINSASGTGATGVSGDASARTGTTYGVYGHDTSSDGYGVYSAGRLGTSGALVCSQCVTGADVDASTLPTVPNASKLGGHARPYFARMVPLSWIGSDNVWREVADVDGVQVWTVCASYFSPPRDMELAIDPGSAQAVGTVNFSRISATGTADAGGFPEQYPVPPEIDHYQIADSVDTTQVEGTAIYRSNATGRIVTINYHLYGAGCELFGDVLTTG